MLQLIRYVTLLILVPYELICEDLAPPSPQKKAFLNKIYLCFKIYIYVSGGMS